ncbi:MAG: hypothetical protein GTN62_05920 [Gemmatimonadales bacterium]|nr:hypothetical protein [Gemmatimonadales bacterium]NIN11034.1 hypothetical protein [Gemmatimonadales bacterium]NIN49631.1 hypothetical protein [Gemmatimonadales bacterium]NIP07095.1 hypothetical protein [Gemmatimonadales bacterium]NIQ99486.1 hypothetical protein [Gemmatimonadales bacterium]
MSSRTALLPAASQRGLVLAVGLALCGAVAEAQTLGPLITDRPDQTESASAVRPGFAQLELGWTLSQHEDGGVTVRSHAVPQALARIGVARRLEARLGFSGWQRMQTRDAGDTRSVAGVGDLDVGFKYMLARGVGLRPGIALLAGLTLPTGQEGFATPRVDPVLLLAAAHELTERVGVGYNVGPSWSSEIVQGGDEETLVDLSYSVALGLSLHDRVGAFVESFGSFALSTGSASRHSLDGGFTLLVRDNLQLDVSSGLTLTGGVDSWFVGAGVALRVPR